MENKIIPKKHEYSVIGYKRAMIDGVKRAEHILIMEQYLGRNLLENEVVHHINQDKLDNRIENLKVMSKQEHDKLSHNKKRHINNYRIENIGELEDFNKKYPIEIQKTLGGKSTIKKPFKLCKNQKELLGYFYYNQHVKWTRNKLFKVTISMHKNTISNFLEKSETNGWIERCRIIDGIMVNNLMMFKKFPDTFEDGQIVRDRRSVYYKITKFGKEVCKLNGIN